MPRDGTAVLSLAVASTHASLGVDRERWLWRVVEVEHDPGAGRARARAARGGAPAVAVRDAGGAGLSCSERVRAGAVPDRGASAWRALRRADRGEPLRTAPAAGRLSDHAREDEG